MFRVWGGGAIVLKSFYDVCDEFGILLYYDRMYIGEQNHGAIRSHDVKDEIIHFIRTFSPTPVSLFGVDSAIAHTKVRAPVSTNPL
jgi:hypothetical protein